MFLFAKVTVQLHLLVCFVTLIATVQGWDQASQIAEPLPFALVSTTANNNNNNTITTTSSGTTPTQEEQIQADIPTKANEEEEAIEPPLTRNANEITAEVEGAETVEAPEEETTVFDSINNDSNIVVPSEEQESEAVPHEKDDHDVTEVHDDATATIEETESAGDEEEADHYHVDTEHDGEDGAGDEEKADHHYDDTEHDGLVKERHHEINEDDHHDVHVHDAYGVLFPWFAEALGLIVFFIISRYMHALPYTAVLFVIGVCMGVGNSMTTLLDQLTLSTNMWSHIDSEVLLLVFLPGLLFRDALGVNFHLFTQSIWQIMWLAFPMVLLGTTLTACVGYYIFPYSWSWNLSMTFGSILAATDPVAVSALLNEVGAPPRLKMHISGESMFNDGSAIVFFNIFASLFLYELNLGLGQEYTIGEGFIIFIRLALGGIAVGMAFAIALVLVLYVLDKRLNTENNIVQVTATITVAYLSFYISEVVCGMSGVLSVVVCGILTRAFAASFINDHKMMESFWVLVEHMLNTLLFTLGGVVWGTILIDSDTRDAFNGMDWFYLIILYLLLMVIRSIVMLVSYPLFSNIGLKTNWREMTFLTYGGLRGAVGIALALSLDNKVRLTGTMDPEILAYSNKVFAMVGGIAFLTLVVNGTTAGPILIRLGLTKVTDARTRILMCHRIRLRNLLKRELGKLLSYQRYQNCPFDLLVHHTIYLKDLTKEEVLESINEAKERGYHHTDDTHQHSRRSMHRTRQGSIIALLMDETNDPFAGASNRDGGGSGEESHRLHVSDNIIVEEGGGGDSGVETDISTRPVGGGDDGGSGGGGVVTAAGNKSLPPPLRSSKAVFHMPSRDQFITESIRNIRKTMHWSAKEKRNTTKELRMVFIELVRAAYDLEVENGVLDARNGHGFVYTSLIESLEFCADDVNQGLMLDDWDYVMKSKFDIRKAYTIFLRGRTTSWLFDHFFCCSTKNNAKGYHITSTSMKYQKKRMEVLRTLAYIRAHRYAEKKMSLEMQDSPGLNVQSEIVIEESRCSRRKAEEFLSSITLDDEDLTTIMAHQGAIVLLTRAAQIVEKDLHSGVLTRKEAEHYLEEIDEGIHHATACDVSVCNVQTFHNQSNRSKHDSLHEQAKDD